MRSGLTHPVWLGALAGLAFVALLTGLVFTGFDAPVFVLWVPGALLGKLTGIVIWEPGIHLVDGVTVFHEIEETWSVLGAAFYVWLGALSGSRLRSRDAPGSGGHGMRRGRW